MYNLEPCNYGKLCQLQNICEAITEWTCTFHWPGFREGGGFLKRPPVGKMFINFLWGKLAASLFGDVKANKLLITVHKRGKNRSGGPTIKAKLSGAGIGVRGGGKKFSIPRKCIFSSTPNISPLYPRFSPDISPLASRFFLPNHSVFLCFHCFQPSPFPREQIAIYRNNYRARSHVICAFGQCVQLFFRRAAPLADAPDSRPGNSRPAIPFPEMKSRR